MSKEELRREWETKISEFKSSGTTITKSLNDSKWLSTDVAEHQHNNHSNFSLNMTYH